jgi:Ca2+-binding EF-hand superfamily protein
MNNINKGRKNIKNRKSSSLPKDYFTYRNNNLNLDYSKEFNQNNNDSNILQRNNDINKINFYHTNRIAYKNVYRNPPRNNNNNYPNLNRSYYFLESSSKNNNFKIDQLDNKIPIPKNNINNNKKRINMNNNNINKSKNKNNNNIINSNKFGSLNNLFLDFIKQDNAIESMRQILSGREDSNLMDLFSLFDHKGNKLIYASDFIKSLKEFGLYINMEDIKYIYRKFNKKINESFDFDEFCEIILPKKYSNEKIMGSGNWTNLSKNKNYYRGISIETKKMLGALFKNIIDGEKSNEKFRRILAENNELSGNDLFNKIKKNYSVGIYKEDIANFMKKNKYKLNNNEIELLMDRFDKNKNGMIDYKEFIIEISPMNKQ